jgi:tetratricopeptide (TPR) repeat protein
MEFFSINFVNILQHAINHQHGLTAIKAFAAMLACTALTACTTAGQVLFSLLPDGTVPVLLSNFERESDTNRRRVAELERAGDWAGLAKFADENLEKDKVNTGWWMVAGYAHSRLTNYARAVECYREVIRLEPDSAAGWNLLAQTLRESAVTLLLLGESHSDLGEFAQAVRPYRQALDIDGGLSPAWTGLARAYIRLGQLGEAESIARSLDRTDPPLAAAIRREIGAK